MSFNTPAVTLTARKQHQCTWCFEPIPPGEKYVRWVTLDDSAYTSKMHPECKRACADTCEECGDWEYMPGEGERPAVGEFGRTA